MDPETLESLRFTFQRVLTPIVVLIGCAGNGISVLVLTRRRMRCSTNVYLTALAFADIVFLIFVLLLSLQHHHGLHEPKNVIYWKLFGLLHWICDAAAYTSIWLTVSFTIERYIAVCHPIRGQILCTESRAKKVIAICFVLCFLLTISTAFEYQVDEGYQFVTLTTNEPCPFLPNTNTTTITYEVVTSESVTDAFMENDDFGHLAIQPGTQEPVTTDNISMSVTDEPKFIYKDGITCKELPYMQIVASEFGKDHTYKTIFYVMTTILFVFGPLILLATLNCFLIAAVHRSHNLRKTMTNNSMGGESSSQQENKITIILIGVCVLFFVCQSPTAIVLLYQIIAEPEDDSVNMLALGNVLNFLITVNAALNFVLYCVLSEKYRHTAKQLLCGKNERQVMMEPFKLKTNEAARSDRSDRTELEKL